MERYVNDVIRNRRSPHLYKGSAMQFGLEHARRQLIGWIVAANAALVVVLAVALWNSRQQELEIAEVGGDNLALALERHIGGLFDKIDLALNEVADDLERQLSRNRIDHEEVSRRAESLARQIPLIEVLRYSDSEGKVTAGTGYPINANAIFVGDRDYFAALKSRPVSPMVSSLPVFGRTSNKWVIVFARAYHAPNGDFAGVVLASVAIDQITAVFAQLQLGPAGAVSLIDPAQRFIARHPLPPDPKTLGSRVPQDEILRRLIDGEVAFNLTFRATTDGQERLYSFRRLNNRPYYLVVGQAVKDLELRWQKELLTALAVWLLAASLSAWAGRQLILSWRRHDRAAAEVGVEHDRYRRLAEELEDRVEARTADLMAANAELKHAIEQVAHSEKFVALGSLVAGVAHELNAPIGNIRLASSGYQESVARIRRDLENGSLRQSALKQFLGDCDRLLAILERNASRAAELSDSIKTVAVDQSSDRRREFDLKNVLDDILLALQPKIKRSPHRVEVAVRPGIVLDSYPGALGQIVTNLVENALIHAFSPTTPGRLEISADTVGDRVTLRCRDNGVGIPAEHLKHVFEPFFSTRVDQGGSGLGLHLVRTLARDPLGGDVSCQSAPGEGTEFVLELPKIAPRAAA